MKLDKLRIIKLLFVAQLMLLFLLPSLHGSMVIQMPSNANAPPVPFGDHTQAKPYVTAATMATPTTIGEYLVLHHAGQTTQSRAASLEDLMRSRGIAVSVLEVADVLNDPGLLRDASAIIIDGSVGSENGSTVPESVITSLIQADRPVILLGNASWIVPSLSGQQGPPTKTAPASQTLQSGTGAVYTSYPNSIAQGSSLTSETLVMPVHPMQTEHSRLVNLTRSNPAMLPVLQYQSYPLDMFILGLQDPNLWTSAGQDFFENVIAYATSLSETLTSSVLGQTQANETIPGGFAYGHIPEIRDLYYATHVARDLLSSLDFANWALQRQSKVLSVLEELYVDEGSVAGFRKHALAGTTDLTSTAQGLWLMNVFQLTAHFTEAEVIAYLANQQDVDGGFSNDIMTTYLVVDALVSAGSVDVLDVADLVYWLHECQVKAGDSSDPATWGGFGKNPTDGNPSSLYTFHGLVALSLLNESHDDLKTVEWLWNRMNGDGSFDNTITDGSDLLLGTPSAIGALEIFSRLDSGNRTQSLAWLSSMQLATGGFGANPVDIVGKTRETAYVALSMSVIGAETHPVSQGIVSFLDRLESNAGFDGMEIVPSLMWGYYLGSAARFSHASGEYDVSLLEQYLSGLSDLSIYPPWANITAYISPEYIMSQYWMKSVWTYYFGVALSNVTGIGLGDTSYISSYLTQQQDPSGHFKPYIYPSTPHMQYSVAAIEALYLLDSLDSIAYRNELESAILNEYNTGRWSSSGWTLEPFAGNQPMIDYLSTRAAARLGVLNESMAAELVLSISGRLQYADLFLLSQDIATLALLDSHFSTNYLAIIDEAQVLASLLTSNLATTGWYNTTPVWQPLYTRGILEMVSSLGLRTNLSEHFGSLLSATLVSTPVIGSSIDIDISITSAKPRHSIYARAFGDWFLFTDVSNSDTISIPVPDDSGFLGPCNISVMLWDYGDSRAFDLVQTIIGGNITGDMNIDSASFLVGDLINGTATWTLEGSIDAGLTNITIRLGDEVTYQQWSYIDVSPFSFSIPTIDFDSGRYNLTIILEKDFCTPLTLLQEISLDAPVFLSFDCNGSLRGNASQQLSITWDLLFVENDSQVQAQQVNLTILDETAVEVHSDTVVSSTGLDAFIWTPAQRGNYTFILSTSRNGTIEAASFQGNIEVSESSELLWSGNADLPQYSWQEFQVLLIGETGVPLGGRDVHVVVTAPSSTRILDNVYTANSSGYISFQIYLAENGFYNLSAEFSGEFLIASAESLRSVNSYSNTSMSIEGIDPEGLVNQTWDISARLVDAQGVPLVGKNITLIITYLPSTTIHEETLTTNATGQVLFHWTFPAPGQYSVEAVYTGAASLLPCNVTALSDLYLPSVASIVSASPFEVSMPGWVLVLVEDHDSNPLTGVTLSFVVRDPSSAIVFSTTEVTSEGYCNISFTPTVRGMNTLEIIIQRQGWIESSSAYDSVDVFEHATLSMVLDAPPIAVGTGLLTVTIRDSSDAPVGYCDVELLVTLGGVIEFDDVLTADSNGQVTLFLNYTAIGALHVEARLPTQSWLYEELVTSDWTVLGRTTLLIEHNGLPVDQGTTIGFTVTLVDWMDSPLAGGDVSIIIEYSNGTILRSLARVTGSDGMCVFGHTFDEIDDFVIRASYLPSGLNASSEDTIVQRVTVTPALILQSLPTRQLGETVTFEVGALDNLDNFISGRSLTLSVEMGGVNVFETTVSSSSDVVEIHWTPSSRGLAVVTLLHYGDLHYLSNSTGMSVSILEVVAGQLDFERTTIDLFDSVVINYTLTCEDPAGIVIEFEILDSDMLPIWSTSVMTDLTGVASVNYTADAAYGVLSVIVGPSTNQFLTGGDIQALLTVKTYATPNVVLSPNPAIVLTPVNITILLQDELGGYIDGISVYLDAYYQGNKIDLGGFTGTARVDIHDGLGVVTFTPAHAGAYSFRVSYSGGSIIYPFDVSGFVRNVHSPTYLTFASITTDLQTGNELNATIRLTDYEDTPMQYMTIHLSLEGVESVDLVTDENGEITYSALMDSEGTSLLSVTFDGYTIYLASSNSTLVRVRTSTSITAEIASAPTPVANEIPVTVSVLLRDESGSSLEGRTIEMAVYYEGTELLWTENIIPFGQAAEERNVTLPRMGNYTLMFTFAGTDSYYPSSTALEVFAKGTSHAQISIPASFDRAEHVTANISILDESGVLLAFEGLDCSLLLNGKDAWDDFAIFNDTMLAMDFHGSAVGNYTLLFIVHDSVYRIGTNMTASFMIQARTYIHIISEDLSGITYQEHTLEIFLNDSLGDTIEGAALKVSIWNPEGDEIYGSIISTTTTLETQDGKAIISWTPTKAGNYSVEIWYEGSDFILPTEIEVSVYARHETLLDATAPPEVRYPDVPSVTMTLQSGYTKLSNQPLTVRLVLINESITSYLVTTDTWGRANCLLVDLVAGNLTIVVRFEGTETYAPVERVLWILVYPDVEADLDTIGNHDVGANVTLRFSVLVHRVNESFTGKAIVEIHSPSPEEDVVVRAWDISSQEIWEVPFVLHAEGEYVIVLTIQGLPLLNTYQVNFTLLATQLTFDIPMEASTTPIIGSGLVVSVLALVVKQRIGGTLDSIVVDWDT